MVNPVLEKPSQAHSTTKGSHRTTPQSKAARINNQAGVDTQGLHSQTIKSKGFQKIKANDKSLDKDVKALLKRYKTDTDEYHKAALSADGKSLVISHDGKTTLSQNFGGTSALSRVFYKLTGLVSKTLGYADRNIASSKYKKFFNNYDNSGKDLGMVHEPLSHLFKGLATNHYHGVSIFHKDEKTGKFTKTPSAISIIDSYKYIFEEHAKLGQMPPELQAKKEYFSKAYALDKTIPLDLDKAKDFLGLYKEIAEGLYQAQGYSFLSIPGQVHQTLVANTDDLNYIELPYYRVQQGSDKKWKALGNKKELDEDLFENKKDRQFFESKLIDSEHTNLTIIRSKELAQEKLEPFIAYMENWSQMYSGSTLRSKDKESQKLIHMTQHISSTLINIFNNEVL